MRKNYIESDNFVAIMFFLAMILIAILGGCTKEEPQQYSLVESYITLLNGEHYACTYECQGNLTDIELSDKEIVFISDCPANEPTYKINIIGDSIFFNQDYLVGSVLFEMGNVVNITQESGNVILSKDLEYYSIYCRYR